MLSTSTKYLGEFNASDAGVQMQADPTSGYPTLTSSTGGTATVVTDKSETVLTELSLHGLHYSNLDSAGVVALADATKQAAATHTSVAANMVVSVPRIGLTADSTKVDIEFFVTGTKKDELFTLFQQQSGKAYESAVQNSVNALTDIAAAKTTTSTVVLASLDQLTTGTGSVAYTKVVVVDDGTTTMAPTTGAPTTAGPTTMAPNKLEKVKTVVTIQALDYDKVMANEAAKTELVSDIKQSILSSLPANVGYTVDNIAVTLRKGSVIADVEIETPATADASAAQTALQANKNTVNQAVTAAVSTMSSASVADLLEDGRTTADLVVSTADVMVEIITTLPPTTTEDPAGVQGYVADLSMRSSLQPFLAALLVSIVIAQVQ